MVNNGLIKSSLTILMLTFSFCFFSVQADQNKLILSIDKTESELGRPIRVNLYGVDLNVKVSKIDLTPLKKDFGVIVDYAIDDTSDKRWPNKHIQILKFKLFPRKEGELTIPIIHSNNDSTLEKVVLIKSGKTTNAPRLSLSNDTPYEQQQFSAHITMLSSDSTARLLIDPTHNINNFESIPLSFQRNKKQNGLYELKIGWALTALQNGVQNLNLPAIEYTVSGVSRRKFFLPSINISTKALPLYLPPTIPISKISIESNTTNDAIFNSNSISYFYIKLVGNLNSSYKFPPILRQLKSNSQIKFFPAITTRTFKNTTNRLTSIVNHSIPFKPLKSGFIALPQIKLQYFDPSNGKITTLTHEMNNIYALSVFWKMVCGFILILVVIYLFKLFYKKWSKFDFSKTKREQALQLLQENKVENIREALKLLTESEYWKENITITQWGESWKEKYHVTNTFDAFIEQLSYCFYSTSEECKTKELSTQLALLIKNKNKNTL